MNKPYESHNVHSGRIDFHHHFVPPFIKFTKEHYYNAVGYKMTDELLDWSPEVSLKAMDSLGVQYALLSLTGSPSPNGEWIGEANRSFARKLNLYVSEICSRYPGRFGFFANIPIPSDTEAALAEIAYALDVLHADGINLASSYGKGVDATYLGDPIYQPIWAELNRRQAVVFVHGDQVEVYNARPYPKDFHNLPSISVPIETFKAASSLVMSGTMRTYPNLKIVLAHFAGVMPFLAARIAVLGSYMAQQMPEVTATIKNCPATREEILEDFKRFYMDCGLAGYETSITAVENFCGVDKLLFGSDYPAVTTEMVAWNTGNVERYFEALPTQRDALMRGNALKLLPHLKGRLE